MEDLRERFFGPSFELMSHDKVSAVIVSFFYVTIPIKDFPVHVSICMLRVTDVVRLVLVLVF